MKNENKKTKKNVKVDAKIIVPVIATATVTTLVLSFMYNKKIKAVHFGRFYEGEVSMKNFLIDAIPDMTFEKMEDIIETFASKNNNDILK